MSSSASRRVASVLQCPPTFIALCAAVVKLPPLDLHRRNYLLSLNTQPQRPITQIHRYMADSGVSRRRQRRANSCGSGTRQQSFKQTTVTRKFRKDNISDTIAVTATLSCRVIQLGMLLGRRCHMWPWPSLTGSKRLDLLFDFPFPVCRRLDLKVLIWYDRAREGDATVFAFWPTLTYFCDCDTVIWQV